MTFHEKATAHIFALVISLGYAAGSQAQVVVKDPWVRTTVPNQQVTGAFMQLTSKQNAKLIKVLSPVAGLVEVHEMTMDKGIMKMRPVNGLVLPAGKTVELKSSGYHLMMMNLTKQIKTGDEVLLTLVFEGTAGKTETVEVKAVAALVEPSR